MEHKQRCNWVRGGSDLYVTYHDKEWGIPVREDGMLFEMLLLEFFQAGLSWLTILRKREAFREAFDGFDAQKIAAYDAEKVSSLLSNAAIIRSRGKILAAIGNAGVFLDIQKEFGSFSNYLWGFTQGKVVHATEGGMPTQTPLSKSISDDLKRRGMKYAGSVTVYSYLQAVGVVNDHEKGCFLHADA